MQDIEKRMSYLLSRIDTLQNNVDQIDSLEAANSYFLNYLKQACLNPAVIKAPLNSINNKHNFSILTSEDGKLRIYNWDSETGGTMYFFDAVAQYVTGNTTKVEVLNDIADLSEKDMHTGFLYLNIYTIHTRDAKTIYLVYGRGIYSGREAANNIEAISIDNGKYKHVPLFKTQTKSLSVINFAYDNVLCKSDPNIKLSDDKSKLYIPVVDKDETTTGKYLIYKFDGYNFVYDKNAK